METYFPHLSPRQTSHQRPSRVHYRITLFSVLVVLGLVSAIVIYSGRLPL